MADVDDASRTDRSPLLADTPNIQSPEAGRPTKFVIVLTLFVAIGGFLFGYDTGVMSGALLLVTDEFHLSSLQQEWVIASTTAGAMVGALVAGKCADWLGRRPCVMIAAVIFVVGALVMGLAGTLPRFLRAPV